GLLLFFNQLIEFDVAVANSLGDTSVKILIIERVAVAGRSTGIIKGQLAAVHAVLTPINRVLLADDLNSDTGFGQLTRYHLANFFILEMSIRRNMQLDVKSVGIARLGQQLAIFLRIIGITLHVVIIAEHVRGQGTIQNRTVIIKDMFHNHLWIYGMIDGLAHELIVERLVGYMHPHEIHPKPGNLFNARPRIFVDAGNFVDGQIADDIRLASEQARHPRGFLFHAFEYHLLDFRLWSPVVIVSRQR